MRIIIFAIGFVACSLFIYGQETEIPPKVHLPRHFISLNPLNILLFQQAGITYEYKAGTLGFGITTGYIYPNKKEYSNWFIAGPIEYGSLGFYSGVFIVPQLNVYLTKPKNPKKAGLVYVAFKGVYKYMTIDSTNSYAWDTRSDDYYWIYRKMVDRVNILGAFIDFGFKFVRDNFFFDLNIGPGMLFVNHNMIIAGQTFTRPSQVSNVKPPRSETFNEKHFTINFTLNFGVAF
ncbi:MAG: hypothetical protein ABSE72_04305 [Bacteroidales bacterium]